MQADWERTRASPIPAQPVRTGSQRYEALRLVRDALETAGEPLTPADRTQWESRLGHDLSRVRVHSDERAARAADAADASAFTVGRHLVFGAGQPVTSDQGRLLGHELVHAVQQRFADLPNKGLVVGPADGPAETAARRVAAERAGEQSPRPRGSAWEQRGASPLQMDSGAPRVQRQERHGEPPSGTRTTKKVQKPIKIEHKVPATDLKKHATGATARPASSGTTPKGPPGSATQRGRPAGVPRGTPATAPHQPPGTAPHRPPGTGPHRPPATAPQQAPGTARSAPPKAQAPSATTSGTRATEPQRPAAPSATTTPGTSPEHESRFFAGGKGFGLDLQLQPQGALGARDRFDPLHPDTPLSAPQWRGGPILTAGDIQLPINVVLLDRELRIVGGETVNFGFEPQLVITPLGFSPREEGWHYQPAIAAGLDLLHWKIMDDLDWHIIQGQAFIQGDVPLSGNAPSLWGGGFQTGTGVELAVPHPGRPDERFTVGASLNGQALWTSDGNFSYAIVGSIFFTWHIRHH